jgi:hypothetical protein
MKMLKQFITAFTLAALLVVSASADIVRVSPVSRSGTITTGGTAQTFAAANIGRFGFAIRNVSAGSLWISNKGTATADHNALEIKAGELYESPEHGVPVGAISIIGATTGQAFFGEEW